MTPYALYLMIGFLGSPGAVILDTQERFATRKECVDAAEKENTRFGVKPRVIGRCVNLSEFYPITELP